MTYIYEKLRLLADSDFTWVSPFARQYIIDGLSGPVHAAFLTAQPPEGSHQRSSAWQQNCSRAPPGGHRSFTCKRQRNPWNGLLASNRRRIRHKRLRTGPLVRLLSSLKTALFIPSLPTKPVTRQLFPACISRRVFSLSHLRFVSGRRSVRSRRTNHYRRSTPVRWSSGPLRRYSRPSPRLQYAMADSTTLRASRRSHSRTRTI